MAVKSLAQKRKLDELLASGKMSEVTHAKLTAPPPTGTGKLPERTTWAKAPGASFKVKVLRAQKVAKK